MKTCPFCGSPANDRHNFTPPPCAKHGDILALLSALEQQKIIPTAETLTTQYRLAKQIDPTSFTITEAELVSYVAFPFRLFEAVEMGQGVLYVG